MARHRKWKTEYIALIIALVFWLTLIISLAVYLPGGQARIAYALVSGNVDDIQTRVYALEQKANTKVLFTEGEQQFLRDLYSVFYKGARLVGLRYSAKTMRHYLHGAGRPLIIDKRLFRADEAVGKRMTLICRQIAHDYENGSLTNAGMYRSKVFYAGDGVYELDRFMGIRDAQLSASVYFENETNVYIRWQVRSEYEWPSYDAASPVRSSGSPSYSPIPLNLKIIRSLRARDVYRFVRRGVIPWRRIQSAHSNEMLWINDGLGAYLAETGLAVPYTIYAGWVERTNF